MQQEKKYESDARATPPSFGEMVEMIKKLFTDYLEDVIKAKPSEITKSWERYNTLNHLFQEEHGVSEDDDQLKFSLERGDLWKTRALAAELALEERKGAEWVKAKPVNNGFYAVKFAGGGYGGRGFKDGEWNQSLTDSKIIAYLDESGQSKGGADVDKPGLRETIEDIILSAGKHNQEQCTEIADAILREAGQSKEGNKAREVSMLKWIITEKWKPATSGGWVKHNNEPPYVLTNKQLWNEWNNQQNRNK